MAYRILKTLKNEKPCVIGRYDNELVALTAFTRMIKPLVFWDKACKLELQVGVPDENGVLHFKTIMEYIRTSLVEMVKEELMREVV